MTKRQILDSHRLEYRKIIRLAQSVFDFWMIEPETDIMIYDYLSKFEAVTLSDNVVYILTITFNITDFMGIYMKTEPFKGFGKNGLLII